MLLCLLCWTFKFGKKFLFKIFFHISFLKDPHVSLLCHSSINIFQYSIQLFTKIIFILTYLGDFNGSPCTQPSITLKFRSFFHLTLKLKRWQIWDLMKNFLIFQLNSQFFTPIYLQLSKYTHLKFYLKWHFNHSNKQWK